MTLATLGALLAFLLVALHHRNAQPDYDEMPTAEVWRRIWALPKATKDGRPA